MKKGICTLLAALLLILAVLPTALAEEAADTVVAVVNGEALYQSDLDTVITSLTNTMTQSGIDVTAEGVEEIIRTTALEQLVNDCLLTQDMTTQGCYELTEEETESILTDAQTAYTAMVQEYAAYFVSYFTTEEDPQTAAENTARTYLNSYGYTLSYLQSYYYNALASAKYDEWLLQGESEVTEEEIRAAYEQKTAESKALYENDAAAFEQVLYNGGEAWYRPEGYRAILQIMLSTEGEDEAAKLASVQEKTDAILTRLAAGEAFQELIREYGEDSSFANESFLETGYQVHRDSVVWDESFVEAAFSEALAAPGDYTQPRVYGDNVHIFYYLRDVPGGPVELTEEISDALADAIRNDRAEAKLTERLAMLKAEAEITY